MGFFLSYLSPSFLPLKTKCTNGSSCPHQPFGEGKNYGASGLTSGFIGSQECFFPSCVVPHFLATLITHSMIMVAYYLVRNHSSIEHLSSIVGKLHGTVWTHWYLHLYRVRHLSDQIKPKKCLIWTPRLRLSQTKQQIFIIFENNLDELRGFCHGNQCECWFN
jgi:hypothetical protein